LLGGCLYIAAISYPFSKFKFCGLGQMMSIINSTISIPSQRKHMKESVISNENISTAFDRALDILSKTREDIKHAGWKLIHKGNLFDIYKRKEIINDSDSPIEYLMTGSFEDLSCRTFLRTQVDKTFRKLWVIHTFKII
jgi:hypothetical protein